MSLNKLILTGRMGDACTYVLDHANPSKNRAYGSIAVNEFRKQADGKKHTNWVPYICWGSVADALAKNGMKGKEITLDGRLRVRKDEKSGRIFFECVASQVIYGNDPLKSPRRPDFEIPENLDELVAVKATQMLAKMAAEAQEKVEGTMAAGDGEADHDEPFPEV